MKFMGKFIFLSLLFLFLSIFLYKYVDRNKYDYEIIKIILKSNNIFLKMDMFFKSLNFPYFFRGIETLISNLVFYFTDTSDINIKIDNFNGVEVMLFMPNKQEKSAPAIIYFHGGGWTFFNPKMYSNYIASLTRKLNIMIVVVNYRKAPEHPYPAGITDAIMATRYFFTNSEKFNVNPARIALMGDSAGGNFVIAIGYYFSNLKKSNKTSVIPKLLIPLNPALQMVDFNTPSFKNVDRDVILTSRSLMVKLVCFYALGELSISNLENCEATLISNSHLSTSALNSVKDNVNWSKLLNGHVYDKHPKSIFNSKPSPLTDRFSELVLDPFFSPLSALNDTDLALLPPVYLLGYSGDPLRDDSKMLAARLSKMGKVGVYYEKSCCHSLYFFSFTGIQKTIDSLNDIATIFENNAIL